MSFKGKTSRRHFMLGSLAAGASLGVFGGIDSIWKLARAAEPSSPLADRNYIFCYFSGGWDILLSLDPKDPDIFTYDQVQNTKILPGYNQLDTNDLEIPVYYSTDMNGTPVKLGAYLGDLATEAKYRNQISIVRGINMETLSHGTGRRRFVTGKPPAGVQARGSSAATWLASQLGADNLIPNLVVRTETFNVDQPTYASGIKFSNVSDMLQALRPTEPMLGTKIDHQIDELIRQTAACEHAQQSAFLQATESSRKKANQMVASGVDQAFDFLANSAEMDALRERFNFAKNTSGIDSSQGRAALAAKAITSGVARCVSVSLTGGLDTHFDNWTTEQGPRQRAGFNSIARIIDELSETPHPDGQSSWMDHTNIVAFSEFSRSPRLNTRGGRDHWLNNACLMVGPDVKGGQIIGASSDTGMEPMAVNLQTGQLQPDGEALKPEHVLQTLYHGVGISEDPADLRCDPIGALLK